METTNDLKVELQNFAHSFITQCSDGCRMFYQIISKVMLVNKTEFLAHYILEKNRLVKWHLPCYRDLKMATFNQNLWNMIILEHYSIVNDLTQEITSSFFREKWNINIIFLVQIRLVLCVLCVLCVKLKLCVHLIIYVYIPITFLHRSMFRVIQPHFYVCIL